MVQVARLVISACSRIIRLTRATVHPKEEKATTNIQWVFVKIVGLCLGRLGAIGSSQRQTGPVKTDAKSLGTDSKNTIHSVYASSKYPGKERAFAWKNASQNSSSAQFLQYEIWGPDPWRDSKRTAMCPRQGLEPCQQHFSYFLFARGNSRLRQQKSRRKKSLWWIPELAYTRSARKTLTLPSWRPWGHRGVLRRWWRPTARCKPEKKPRFLSKNWTYSWRCCFLKKHTRSSFTREALRGSWVFLPLDQRSKTTSHQKWQENWLKYIDLCAIRSPWFIDEFI